MRSRLRWVVATAIVGCAVGFACARAVDERPVVSLASSPESEARFASLRLRWIAATPPERAGMRPELSALQAWLEARGDGLEPVARAYLAVAWLDSGVPTAAEAIARPLYEGPPGVTHDLGILVLGVAQRREGHSDLAVETLRPIIGKLIDPFARPLLYEEITQALIDQGRYDEAIVFAQAWLRAGDIGDRKALHLAVANALMRVPADVARRAIEAERTSKGEAGYSPELMLILAARLDLPDEEAYADGGLFTSTDGGVGDALVKIPSLGDAAAPIVTPSLPIRFDPKTIALLVPSSASGFGDESTSTTRAASACISPVSALADGKKDAGVLASDAGVSAPVATSHQLAVFDTGGTVLGMTKALDAAEHDGAAIVVGGVTQTDADALAALSQARRVPAILFRAPTNPPKITANEKTWFVVLGPSVDDESSITRGTIGAASDVAFVDPYPEPGSAPMSDSDPLHVRCDATPTTADATAFPVEIWRTKKIASVVVLGDAHCARHVVAELQRSKTPYHPRLVLSPSSLDLLHATLPFARLALCVGLLPADDQAPAPLQALWAEQKSPVGFWSALGHDAATIAMAATPGDLLPSVETAAIQAARSTTRDRLFSSKNLQLWSTEQKAVPASGVVVRKWFVRQVGAGGAWRPSWAAD